MRPCEMTPPLGAPPRTAQRSSGCPIEYRACQRGQPVCEHCGHLGRHVLAIGRYDVDELLGPHARDQAHDSADARRSQPVGSSNDPMLLAGVRAQQPAGPRQIAAGEHACSASRKRRRKRAGAIVDPAGQDQNHHLVPRVFLARRRVRRRAPTGGRSAFRMNAWPLNTSCSRRSRRAPISTRIRGSRISGFS
jgi:hypothetical protein